MDKPTLQVRGKEPSSVRGRASMNQPQSRKSPVESPEQFSKRATNAGSERGKLCKSGSVPNLLNSSGGVVGRGADQLGRTKSARINVAGAPSMRSHPDTSLRSLMSVFVFWTSCVRIQSRKFLSAAMADVATAVMIAMWSRIWDC